MQDVRMPTPEDSKKAEEARRVLEAVALDDAQEVVAAFGESRVQVTLPRAVFESLLEILRHVRHGRAVTLVPIHAELTTQQAAKILNVSRPYVIQLLDEGKIPFHTVGKHRRIRAENLFTFKKQMKMDMRAAADELAALGQELGLDD